MLASKARGTVYCLVSLALFSLRAQTAAAAKPASDYDGLYGISPYIALREVIPLLPARDQKAISPAEIDLYSLLDRSKLNELKTTEIVLTVAGVTDEAKRQHYRDRIKEITDEARDQIADAKTTENKATILAKYLYEGPCHAGFKDNQFDICQLLDSGEFNCLSSTILYNLVADNLGVRTRCVEIPGHVFLRVGDLYIEPVAGETYSAKEHEKIVKDFWDKAPENIRALYTAKDHTFVTGNIDLNGKPYTSRTADDAKNNRPDLCMVDYLQAACFNPSSPTLHYFVELWVKRSFTSALENRQFSKAQKIAAVYGQLFGDGADKLFAQVAAARAGKPIKS